MDSLEKHTGITSQGEIKDKKPSFEEGTFGFVHDVSISLGQEKRKIAFVVKEFKEEGGAEKAFEAYRKLKEMGLKVPPTYRLDRKNNRILMTSYNKNNKAAIAASSDNEHVGDLDINILNLEKLKGDLIEQCHIAAKNRVRLPIDSFFFIISTDGGDMDVDFVIGDLDLIFTDYAAELNLDEEGYVKENEKNAREALKLIMDKYCSKKQNEKKLESIK